MYLPLIFIAWSWLYNDVWVTYLYYFLNYAPFKIFFLKNHFLFYFVYHTLTKIMYEI